MAEQTVERVVYTAGPWKARRAEFEGAPAQWWDVTGLAPSSVIPDITVDQPICTCYSAGYANAEANAQLIAAAPELLAALMAIVEHEQIDGIGIRYTFDFNSQLGKQARAAIAKAEGR